jgi:hypothetical protein
MDRSILVSERDNREEPRRRTVGPNPETTRPDPEEKTRKSPGPSGPGRRERREREAGKEERREREEI